MNLGQLSINRPILAMVLSIVLLIVGAIAYTTLPVSEYPQVVPPTVVVTTQYPGATAQTVSDTVAAPIEQEINGVEDMLYLYSQATSNGNLTITVTFKLGTDLDKAQVLVQNRVAIAQPRLPADVRNIGVTVAKASPDLMMVVHMYSPDQSRDTLFISNYATINVVDPLSRIEGVGSITVFGGRDYSMRVWLDPDRLQSLALTTNDVVGALQRQNVQVAAGILNQPPVASPGAFQISVQTLGRLADPNAFGDIVVKQSDNAVVRLKDVARVELAALDYGVNSYLDKNPAVGLGIFQLPGSNAIAAAKQIKATMAELSKSFPAGVKYDIIYNPTDFIQQSVDAVVSTILEAVVLVVLVVILFLQTWRAAIIPIVAIPVSLIGTFFLMAAFGFSLNNLSLFGLVLAIGIVVDDAIVVVENIVRHWQTRGENDLITTAVEAVAEVGNPTVVATLTIIVALLPMMFVSGLMGPYMRPIPANASMAMLFSFFVAVTVTPWLLYHIARGRFEAEKPLGVATPESHEIGAMGRFYLKIARPLLTGRRRFKVFLFVVAAATAGVCVLFATKDVTVKLLPFDNKSELQVVVDLPQGTTLQDTERFLMAATDRLKDLPELTSIQAYVGTAAPFNFNGLVRHSYLRSSPAEGDLQVNLLPKGERTRASHAIALDVRHRLSDLPKPSGTVVKVVEVPPGPPVLATLLAEVYGPDEAARRAAATKVREAFQKVNFIVDLDDTFRQPSDRLRFSINQENLEFYGVDEQAVYDTIAAIIGGVKVGYSQRGFGAKPIEIDVKLPKRAEWMGERILSTPLPAGGTARQGKNVELGDVVTVRREPASYSLFRRDGRFAEMVQAEVAGRFEAPVYGMLAVEDQIKKMDWGKGGPPEIRYNGQPLDESKLSLLWDGEWEVTYVTFRDMGAAFAVAILGIYLLVVAQFGSFLLPLVILIPVPLTLIGNVLGHWIMKAPFTATSMIGFIALAGIIVRNSILLVDFIRRRRAEGAFLRQALLEAGAIRFKPIFLTAAAAMIGAAFIMADPIFQGLAISLVFGLASSTALTVLVIPAIYIWLRDDHKEMGEI